MVRLFILIAIHRIHGMFYNLGCSSIASAARMTQAQLLALNPSLNCTSLPIGTGICLGLPCSKTYLVAPGDWCAKIKSSQGVSEAVLMSLNPGLSCTSVCFDFFELHLLTFYLRLETSSQGNVFASQRPVVSHPAIPYLAILYQPYPLFYRNLSSHPSHARLKSLSL